MTRSHHINLFDIPGDITYLNTAFMAPRLKSVSKAGHDTVDKMGQPWKLGWEMYFDEVEQARKLLAEMLNGPADSVAMVHSVSYGIQLAAQALEPGLDSNSEIVLLEDQFPSNVYSWMEVAKRTGATIKTVSFPTDGNWTPGLLEAIGENTRIVTIPNCHWLDGSMINLIEVSQKCHAVGSALVLDVSQSMGVIPLDVAQIKPDFVVSVCYKWLLGPHGVSFIYADPKHHDKMPLEHHAFGRANAATAGNANTQGVEYCPELQNNARRFDTASRSNLYLMPMVIAALTQIQNWKVDNIQSSLRPVIQRVSDWCSELNLHCPVKNAQAPHLIGVRLGNEQYERMKVQMLDEKIYATYRNGILRVAPYLFVEPDDIDKLFNVISSHL